MAKDAKLYGRESVEQVVLLRAMICTEESGLSKPTSLITSGSQWPTNWALTTSKIGLVMAVICHLKIMQVLEVMDSPTIDRVGLRDKL